MSETLGSWPPEVGEDVRIKANGTLGEVVGTEEADGEVMYVVVSKSSMTTGSSGEGPIHCTLHELEQVVQKAPDEGTLPAERDPDTGPSAS